MTALRGATVIVTSRIEQARSRKSVCPQFPCVERVNAELNHAVLPGRDAYATLAQSSLLGRFASQTATMKLDRYLLAGQPNPLRMRARMRPGSPPGHFYMIRILDAVSGRTLTCVFMHVQ